MSSPAASLPAPLVATADRIRRAQRIALSIRPAYVLGGLILAQWLGMLALALSVRHNGWLYYAGGDQLWHYSGAYLLAHGHLPPSYVGYGWSVLLAPLAAVAGPNLVSALPGIVLLNTLILLPVALFCVYDISARVVGRLFGYFAAGLWIALPYLGILFVEPGYHQKYTELTLPQLVGLTSVPDFPAMVALLAAAALCVRALDARTWHHAAAAGLATGASIAIKPSNAIWLVTPFVLLLVERRRALLPYAAGLAPALLTLALWKYRGLGELAATPAEPVRVAAGVTDLFNRINGTELNSWGHLREVLDSLREHFWVARVMEWLPVAGSIAFLLRARRGFLLVGTWFIAYLLTKGTYLPASVEDASFWRIMMPAFPAFLILAASVVLLVPGVRARPPESVPARRSRRFAIAVGAAAVAFMIVPLVVIAATPRLHDAGHQAVRFGDNLIPVAPVGLQAAAKGDTVTLSWRWQRPTGSSVFYRLLRVTGSDGDVSCAGKSAPASDDCELFMDSVTATVVPNVVDHPGHGTWTYRIGVAANWLNDPSLGDVYVVSPPVRVTVP
ncbi:MAG: hypothetical protein M3O92_00020 [Actinomycetota bacterium]|nr:hypothetical protein [Actinomycetota bacterium]